MPYRINIKIIIFFLLFFTITYLESFDIGGTSVASIWKIPFIVYLLFYTYFKHNKKTIRMPIIFFGGLFCLLLPFHSDMARSVLPEIIDIPKFIIIPAAFYYIYHEYRDQPGLVVKQLFWLSIFLIWTNIPYLLGFIQPKVQKDYTASFGESMLQNAGFSGPYMTIHSQSVFMACALIFLTFLCITYKNRFRFKHPFIIATYGIGSYCLYLSFARTGWLLFLIGMLYLFIKNITLKRLYKSLPAIVAGATLVTLLLVYNTSFRQRVLDQREYSNGRKEDEIGSGRLLMAYSALRNWYESDALSIMKGYGLEKGKEKMQERIGVKLFAHNGYIDILQRGGLIGITLFFIFVVSIYRSLKRSKNEFVPLAKGLFWGWLAVGAIQEFTIIYLNLYLAVVLGLVAIFDRRRKVRQQQQRANTPQNRHQPLNRAIHG